MGYFLKGLQQQFILEAAESKNILSEIYNEGCLFYLAYSDKEKEKKPILWKDIQDWNTALQYFIVNKEQDTNIVWERINLEDGGLRYSFDPLDSKGVQFLLSPHNLERISVGRISVCTEWKNDRGEIIYTNREKELFKKIKRILKKSCVGSINSRIWIGKNAYMLWISNKINLAYDLNNPDEYSIGDFISFR